MSGPSLKMRGKKPLACTIFPGTEKSNIMTSSSTYSSYSSSKPQRTQSNQDQHQQQSKPSRKGSFDPSNEKDDLYQILEVEREVNVDDLKKSYRKLALKYHPDKTAGDPESTERVGLPFSISFLLYLHLFPSLETSNITLIFILPMFISSSPFSSLCIYSFYSTVQKDFSCLRNPL